MAPKLRGEATVHRLLELRRRLRVADVILQGNEFLPPNPEYWTLDLEEYYSCVSALKEDLDKHKGDRALTELSEELDRDLRAVLAQGDGASAQVHIQFILRMLTQLVCGGADEMTLAEALEVSRGWFANIPARVEEGELILDERQRAWCDRVANDMSGLHSPEYSVVSRTASGWARLAEVLRLVSGATLSRHGSLQVHRDAEPGSERLGAGRLDELRNLIEYDAESLVTAMSWSDFERTPIGHIAERYRDGRLSVEEVLTVLVNELQLTLQPLGLGALRSPVVQCNWPLSSRITRQALFSATPGHASDYILVSSEAARRWRNRGPEELAQMVLLIAHEGYPGHALQAHLQGKAQQYLGTVVRCGTSLEGWAVYAEQLVCQVVPALSPLAAKLRLRRSVPVWYSNLKQLVGLDASRIELSKMLSKYPALASLIAEPGLFGSARPEYVNGYLAIRDLLGSDPSQVHLHTVASLSFLSPSYVEFLASEEGLARDA